MLNKSIFHINFIIHYILIILKKNIKINKEFIYLIIPVKTAIDLCEAATYLILEILEGRANFYGS